MAHHSVKTVGQIPAQQQLNFVISEVCAGTAFEEHVVGCYGRKNRSIFGAAAPKVSFGLVAREH